jgi:diguanylate cyclase (GGDEF)-like protein
VNPDSSLKPDLPDDINLIVQDNVNLAEQVKRLVRTEYALYNTQLELDNQIQLYKQLYETGKKLSLTQNIDQIFTEMGNFIIDGLNFGGFLVLEKRTSGFHIKRSGGCCRTIKPPDTSGNLYRLFTDQNIVQNTGNDHILSEISGNRTIYNGICTLFCFEKFVTHLFYIGTETIPSYIVIVGNPAEKDLYNEIILNSIHMIGLGNLVSLIENVLNNAVHYQELVREREQLEIKVEQRTNALNKALKNLKKLNSKLEIFSFQDELTGLYNRRGFHIFGEKYFTMAKRKKTSLLILYCDLDKFKSINDLYGHKEGDCALKATASILKNACRDYDIVSRFGGDEFVILFDNLSIDEFELFQQRIKILFVDHNRNSNKGYQILISCGCTMYRPDLDENTTFDELIERADKKLYAEKKKKNRE